MESAGLAQMMYNNGEGNTIQHYYGKAYKTGPSQSNAKKKKKKKKKKTSKGM